VDRRVGGWFATAVCGLSRLDTWLAEPNLVGMTFRCAHCGGVIGAYEPSVVVQSGEMHETSRAAEPGFEYQTTLYYHQVCHDALQSARQPHGDEPKGERDHQSDPDA
jgi:hypothetical protein